MNTVESGEADFPKTLNWLAPVTPALAQAYLLRVTATERSQVNPLRYELYRIFVYNGFMQSPNVPMGLRECERFGLKVNFTYFLGLETLITSPAVRGMAVWREASFAFFIASNAAWATVCYVIPPERVVEIGIHVEL